MQAAPAPAPSPVTYQSQGPIFAYAPEKPKFVDLNFCYLPSNWCERYEYFTEMVRELLAEKLPSPDHDANIAQIDTLAKVTAKTQHIFEELYKSHMALKQIEAEVTPKDVKMIEETLETEGDCHDVFNKNIMQIANERLTTEDVESAKKIDHDLAVIKRPAPDTAAFKLRQARQQFLDSLEKGFLYLESKGMRAVWRVDSSPTIQGLSKLAQAMEVFRPIKGLPHAAADHLKIESVEHTHQFAYPFFQVVIRETYHFLRETKDISTAPLVEVLAIDCLAHFHRIRKCINEMGSSPNGSIESPELLQHLTKFAFTFGKVKALALLISAEDSEFKAASINVFKYLKFPA